MSGHETIEPKYHAMLNALAEGIDGILNGGVTGDDRKVGFCLLAFDFNKPVGGRINYISNSRREDMVIALKEFVASNEGRVYTTETTQ